MAKSAQHLNGPVAFVLSGGGSIGAVQVGMIHSLFARGIAPDLIVAASAGGFNGSFIASRPPTVETAAELASVWRGLRARTVFPVAPSMSGLLGVLGRRNHVASPRGLRALLERWLEFDLLERSPIPLHVIATDVLSGMELRLSSGPALDAIMATAALPGVLPPVRWGGHELVDGGVTNNTPLSHAVELGAARIYVLPTGHPCALPTAPRSPIGVATQALSVLIQQRLVRDIQNVPDGVELVVLPPLCPLDVSPADFSHGAELIERSRAQSDAFLDRLDRREGHAVPELMRDAVHGHAREGEAELA